MTTNPTCANCFEEIRWMPVYKGGETYCCDGCTMGGPCICTYNGPPPRLNTEHILSDVSNIDLPNDPAPTTECANCFEVLNRPPVYHDGLPFCCDGCANGGPCICTYDSAPLELSDMEEVPVPGQSTKANRLLENAGEIATAPRVEDSRSKTNRLWQSLDDETVRLRPSEISEPTVSTETSVEAPTPLEAEPDATERVFGYNFGEGVAERGRIQITVSPLNDVRDVKAFTSQLERMRTPENVLLTYYAGDTATFDLETASTMALMTEFMDMAAFPLRSIQMTPAGIELGLKPRDEQDERVAGGLEEAQPGSPEREGAASIALQEAGSVAEKRSGDEGELHSFRYEMGVDVFFNGRHQIEVGGVKGPVHMHSWRVQAIVVGESFDETGSVTGTTEVREIITEYVTPLNEKLLNRTPPFDEIIPTASNIARVIYDHVASRMDENTANLKSIRLWESPTSYVEYSGE